MTNNTAKPILEQFKDMLDDAQKERWNLAVFDVAELYLKVRAGEISDEDTARFLDAALLGSVLGTVIELDLA